MAQMGYFLNAYIGVSNLSIDIKGFINLLKTPFKNRRFERLYIFVDMYTCLKIGK